MYPDKQAAQAIWQKRLITLLPSPVANVGRQMADLFALHGRFAQ